MDNIAEAIALHQQGNLNAAKGAYQAALKKNPKQADALHLLGVIYLSENQHQKALDHIQGALKIKPKEPIFLNSMGSVYRSLGKLDLAAKQFQKAVNLKANYVEGITNLGDTLQEQGKTTQAIELYRKALIKEGNYQILHNLGSAFQHIADYPNAIQCYQKVLEVNPNFVMSLNNLGNLLIERGNTKDGIALLQKALKINPNLIEIKRNLGMAFSKKGLFEQAEICFNDVLKQNKNDVATLSQLALIKGYTGQIDEAEELCKKAIAINKYAIQAHCTLVDISRFDDIATAIDDLQALSQLPFIDASERMKLHFHLGSLYDKNQQYKEAFDHFQSCNQIRQKISGNFDLKSYQNIYHWLKTHITQDYIDSKNSLADTSNKPIFVIGMPRSGTSLVEQILSSHTLVYGAGEINDMRQYANAFTRFDNETTFIEALNSLNLETAQAIRQAYLDRLDNFSRSSANEPFVVDKLPHNFDALWLIKILFPNAKVIHCRRDPIDTCLSCFMTNFSSGHNYKHDLKTLGTYYNLYKDLMSHWNNIFPTGQILEIDYEELISNPEQNIRALLDYCELEWEDQCLDFHETQRTVKTASYTQVREKLYSRSVKRWKNYEEFLAPLIEELNNA